MVVIRFTADGQEAAFSGFPTRALVTWLSLLTRTWLLLNSNVGTPSEK
jgi:hypothetical protein